MEQKFHSQEDSSAFEQPQKSTKLKGLLQKMGKKPDDGKSITKITEHLKQKKNPTVVQDEEFWKNQVQRQVDEGQPLTDYSNLLFYLSEISFDRSVVLDLIGNYFRGKIENGSISTGILVLKNSSKIELKSGKDEKFYGMIEKDDLRYVGQISNLKREGYGRLMKDGKCIYEGEFYDDFPQGKGVLFDFATEELFFKGLFRKGKKHYGIQFSKDWILKGLFLPIKEEKETYGIKLDFYDYNTNHKNFIFDGIVSKDPVGTSMPLQIKTRLLPEDSASLVSLSHIPKSSDSIQELSVQLSGPCKVEYQDFNGAYIGKFKEGQKSGKGILIDDKGNKLIAIWDRYKVIGKLLWNLSKTEFDLSQVQPNGGSEKKLKSSLKFSSKVIDQKSVEQEAGVLTSILIGTNDQEDANSLSFNHYHPHRLISSRKSKYAKITKVSAEGNFILGPRGVLVQSGYGKLNLSDGSFYQGFFSENLFD